MASAGAWGYVALMDSDVAKANSVPIIGYAIGGGIVGQYLSWYKSLFLQPYKAILASSSHFGGDLQ